LELDPISERKTAIIRFCPVGGRTDVDIVLICPEKILTLGAYRV
jgi:hypothetical protein